MKKYLERIYGKSREEFFSLLKNDLTCGNKRFVITVNPEILVTAEKDGTVKNMLLDQSVSPVPDGIAVVKACSMLDIPVAERITGIETAEYLLKELNRQEKSLYLFGAVPDTVKLLAEKIASVYPNVKLLGYSDGYVEDKDAVFEKIAELNPDVCMVALGVPAQEKLIYKHLHRFEKGIFIGVGGSFDVMSGNKKRAPEVFIKYNLEWLYRIMKEPKRLKRFYDNNIKFLFKIKNTRK